MTFSYLGVELSAYMKWNSHVNKVTAKGNTMLGILHRNLKNCPKNLKDLAYKSILRPKLEYACSIWDTYTAVNIKTLERFQRRSARFVYNKFSYHHHESVTVTSMFCFTKLLTTWPRYPMSIF